MKTTDEIKEMAKSHEERIGYAIARKNYYSLSWLGGYLEALEWVLGKYDAIEAADAEPCNDSCLLATWKKRTPTGRKTRRR